MSLGDPMSPDGNIYLSTLPHGFTGRLIPPPAARHLGCHTSRITKLHQTSRHRRHFFVVAHLPLLPHQTFSDITGKLFLVIIVVSAAKQHLKIAIPVGTLLPSACTASPQYL